MLDELVRRAALGAEVFCLSAEILVTRLSSTVASTPHEARQYRQKVCTVLVLIWLSSPTASDKSDNGIEQNA
jgi:hypothetical protein